MRLPRSSSRISHHYFITACTTATLFSGYGINCLVSTIPYQMKRQPCTDSFASPIPPFAHQQVNSFMTKASHLHQGKNLIARATLTSTSDWGNSFAENDTIECLPFRDGSHNSAKIAIPPCSSGSVSINPENFRKRLAATLATCRDCLKKSSLWVEVPICQSKFTAEAACEGLEYHHAEGNTASLCIWLKDDLDCKIPSYGTHQVGVGAVVTNSRNEILCVREARKNYLPWKIPTGLVELGEQLDEAVTREVFEETGIRAHFQSVLGVRHSHGMQFDRSEMYFVCRLKAVEDGSGIPTPVAEEGEISDAIWLSLDEYRKIVDELHPMMRHIMKLHDQDWEQNDLQRVMIESVVPGRKLSPLYHAPLKKETSN